MSSMAAWSLAPLLALGAQASPATEAHQILSRQDLNADTLQRAIDDLRKLGPGALPAIREHVPRLSAYPLWAAALVLGSAGDRAAAPALALRLRDAGQADERAFLEAPRIA